MDNDMDPDPIECSKRRAGGRLDSHRQDAEIFFADMLERMRSQGLWDGTVKDADAAAEDIARAAMQALAKHLSLPEGVISHYTTALD